MSSSKTSFMTGGILLLAIMIPSEEAAHRICSYSFVNVVCLSAASDFNQISVLPPSSSSSSNNKFQLWERYQGYNEHSDSEEDEEEGTESFTIRNTGWDDEGLVIIFLQGTPTGKLEAVPCFAEPMDDNNKELMSQRWRILTENERGVRIINLETGNCLSTDGTTAFTEICNSSARNQIFDMLQVLEL
jgi:hypothetical protein